MRGNRYRLPRKFKIAWTALMVERVTPRQLRLLARALVLPSMGGWLRVRHHNAHVAMGDTHTLRQRRRQQLRQQRQESGR